MNGWRFAGTLVCLLWAPGALAAGDRLGPARDGRWNEIVSYSAGPGYDAFPAVVFEPFRDLTIVIGDGATASNLRRDAPYPVDNANHPSAGQQDACLVDSKRGRILVFPYYSRNGDNLWILHFGDTLRWSSLRLTGGPPPSLYGTVVLDTRRDRAVFFGGMRYVGDRFATHEETWALSLEDLRWSRLANGEGGPVARYHHVAVYDPVADRMILHGGIPDVASPGLHETWELSFRRGSWRRLRTHGPTPGRHHHGAVYDPRAERVVFFGGIEDAWTVGNPPTLNDVWELSLRGDRWRRLDPAGDAPPTLLYVSAAYDPVRNRMIVGNTVGAWALEWSGRREWVFDPVALESDEAGVVGMTGRLEIVVFDVQGRVVARHRADDWAGSTAEKLQLERGLGRGIYFARLQSNRGMRIVRLVVKR